MMVLLDDYVRRGRRWLQKWVAKPGLRQSLRYIFCFFSGFSLSAAGLGNYAQPLVPGLLCGGITGAPAALMALGSSCGYLLFWGTLGAQGLVWTILGLAFALTLGTLPAMEENILLPTAFAGAVTAATGVIFQLLGDAPPIPIYLLRVGLSMGVCALTRRRKKQREPILDWLFGAMVILALGQLAPLPWLNFGCIGAGYLALAAPFPAAALAGFSLDLAQISPVSMTAALCLSFLLRMIPGLPRTIRWAGAGAGYVVVMYLSGVWDLSPVPGLLLGGAAALLIPGKLPAGIRRGETGAAQVRLELAAGAFSQAQQLLLEVRDAPIDEQALLDKATERACAACPCRKGCQDQHKLRQMSTLVLHRPLSVPQDIATPCRKPGRVLQELRRSQEQLRLLQSDRQRRSEQRGAVIQQYQFLSEYLQELSDILGKRAGAVRQHYTPQVFARTAGKEVANGDKCCWFSGIRGRYYVLLCDGMGTGIGAAEESRTAADLLRRLLTAGFPAAYALRSLNSLCILRGNSGAVTADLVELELESGKANLYKWGAAPSWLLRGGTMQKIGTGCPPPGLSVTEARETVERLSLRRGETLILLSDGAGGEDFRHRAMEWAVQPPGELADMILESAGEFSDDATAAVIRLDPLPLST